MDFPFSRGEFLSKCPREEWLDRKDMRLNGAGVTQRDKMTPKSLE